MSYRACAIVTPPPSPLSSYTLALPLLFGFALAARQPLTGFSRKIWLAILGAGTAFAVDLASWHLGIGQTRLGNATLFGNSGSLIIMVWGLVALRRGVQGRTVAL